MADILKCHGQVGSQPSRERRKLGGKTVSYPATLQYLQVQTLNTDPESAKAEAAKSCSAFSLPAKL
jgi:hypothetical protein